MYLLDLYTKLHSHGRSIEFSIRSQTCAFGLLVRLNPFLRGKCQLASRPLLIQWASSSLNLASERARSPSNSRNRWRFQWKCCQGTSDRRSAAHIGRSFASIVSVETHLLYKCRRPLYSGLRFAMVIGLEATTESRSEFFHFPPLRRFRWFHALKAHRWLQCPKARSRISIGAETLLQTLVNHTTLRTLWTFVAPQLPLLHLSLRGTGRVIGENMSICWEICPLCLCRLGKKFTNILYVIGEVPRGRRLLTIMENVKSLFC